jgi:YVTN family beta-propeller protein
MIEYAMLLMLVSMIAVGMLHWVGTGTAAAFNQINNGLSGGGGGGSTGTGMLYVDNDGGFGLPGTVVPIQLSNGSVGTPIPVGMNPRDIAISPNGTTAYVTNGGDNTVSVISIASGTVVKTIPLVGTMPNSIGITPDGLYAYVSDQFDGSVSVLNLTSNTLSTTIPAINHPDGLVVSPDGTKVYVAENGFTSGTTVAVISTVSNTVVDRITVGYSPSGITITPNGAFVYVGSPASTISVISTATDTVTATITEPWQSCPQALIASPDGSKVYSADGGCASKNTVTVISTASNTISKEITVGNQPWNLGISADSSTVWVSSVGGGNAVYPITIATDTLGSPISVPSPDGLASH